MYAQKKPIENTHIVRERDRQRFRELIAVLFLGVPIGLFLLLFTWQNLEVIRLGREASRLQKQRAALEDQNKNLRLEIERLTSLDSVEQQAVTLGLRPTEASRVILVSRPPLMPVAAGERR
jgi:cell division protein FtsB